MGFLLILPIAALSGWILLKTFRSLREQNASWKRYTFLAVPGLALGIWLTFFLEYRPHPRYRIEAFPIPVTLWHLEGEQWVCFNPPAPIQIGGAITDLLVGLAVACVPFQIGRFIRQFRSEEPLPDP